MLTWHIHNGGMKPKDLFAEWYIAWIKGTRAEKEAVQNLTHLPINQLMVVKIFIYWYTHIGTQSIREATGTSDYKTAVFPGKVKVCVDTLTYRNEQICFQQFLFQAIRWGETGLLLAKHLSVFAKTIHNIYEM